MPATAERPAVSVVVPVYNGAATIGATLAALAAQRLDAPYEVIVVDGGSTDGTPEILGQAGERVTVLHNPLREPASARNLGARRAVAPVLAFTDADCEPAPDWLQAGLRAVAGAEIVQGKVLPREWQGPFDRSLSVTSEYGLYETANLFVRRESFEAVGGFEPIPGLRLADGTHFGEDAWFVWRAKRHGARTTFADDALVRHAVVRRTVRGFLSEIARRRYFPQLVRLIPELRTAFLHHGVFLSPDSLRFDLAAAAVALTVARRRPQPLLLCAPYAWLLVASTAEFPRDQRPRIVAGRAAADAVTLAALLRGSLSARTPVL